MPPPLMMAAACATWAATSLPGSIVKTRVLVCVHHDGQASDVQKTLAYPADNILSNRAGFELERKLDSRPGLHSLAP
ncbi:MAG: hypothetical protein JW839_05070 [Candidatus Lokiarchaeota archaeon]|nr:hypothetical protein [Candidatus Lokiarchaeota archaeon]